MKQQSIMKKTIIMSRDAFMALLTLYQCGGKHLLPEGFKTGNEAMRQFLKGRQELCENGLAELDFDGKVYPTREFARFSYTIPRTLSVMHFQHGASCQETQSKFCVQEWYLRGPIELMRITETDEGFTLTISSVDDLLTWVKENLYATSCEGRLHTQSRQGSLEAELSMTKPGRKERVHILAGHMCLYFEKEKEHA